MAAHHVVEREKTIAAGDGTLHDVATPSAILFAECRGHKLMNVGVWGNLAGEVVGGDKERLVYLRPLGFAEAVPVDGKLEGLDLGADVGSPRGSGGRGANGDNVLRDPRSTGKHGEKGRLITS